ncbi:hypothetical protein [Dyadobacter luticola]|uniref:Uncharacterized protein n=1 Tax=Dyadobacter luticola TaxID=1979387 RepID=A0A5R9L1V9_9BACT|nr:hypothetical protein [Dyadobacter luticola]TLV02552.1 hypothetical protein FEN17_02715 [Dyadobacter luticola]
MLQEDVDQVVISLSAHTRKARLNAFKRMVRGAEPDLLIFLLKILKDIPVSNGYAIVIREMGKSGNPIFIDPILTSTWRYHNDGIIMDALIKLGALDYYINQFPPREHAIHNLRMAAHKFGLSLVYNCTDGTLQKSKTYKSEIDRYYLRTFEPLNYNYK